MLSSSFNSPSSESHLYDEDVFVYEGDEENLQYFADDSPLKNPKLIKLPQSKSKTQSLKSKSTPKSASSLLKNPEIIKLLGYPQSKSKTQSRTPESNSP
jgi:hypothetical protein